MQSETDRPSHQLPGWLVVFRAALAYRRTQIGLGLTVFVVASALFGPLLSPYSPSAFVGRAFATPDAAHWLGTDFRGRDVLARLLYGGLPVVWMSVSAAAIGMILGATTGIAAAYSRGWVGESLMRLMDVFLSIPTIILVLLFVALMGTHEWLIVLLVGISHMPQVARISQGVAADFVERDFVLYAKALGVPRARILLSEILPNMMTPLMVEFGIRIVWSIAAIAALSLMGYGIQAPAADWGLMINENRGRIATRPLPVLAPTLMIALFALGVNLLTEGISNTVSGVARKTGRK